jgi:cyclic pyranopterin phosphate synthase
LERCALVKVAASARPQRLAAAWQEIVGASSISTHLESQGGVRMVDVGEKPVTTREAHAESAVSMSEQAFERLRRADVPKGDVLGTARLAGIMAAKRTAELIPLCHTIRLTKVSVELELVAARHTVAIRAMARAEDRTGVEMEALVAANVAALTVYDMLKAFDRGMEIGPTRLLAKSGGRTGDFQR